MKKMIMIALSILAALAIKKATAIDNHTLITDDGNIWEVLDDLTEDREYTLIFDTLNDDNLYNDKIIYIL